MVRFILKSILVIALMFVAVLFGMEQAQKGIQKMKGYEDDNFAEALHIEEENGEVAVSLLGEEVSSHDLKQKKEKLEEMKAFNFFSHLGKALANGVSLIVEKLVSLISNE